MSATTNLRKIFPVLCLAFGISPLQAQLLNFDKMNRAELREQVAIQLGKVDSLYREVVKSNLDLKKAKEENALLIRSINSTEEEMDGLLRDIKMMRLQITGLETTVKEKESALRRQRVTKDSLVNVFRSLNRDHRDRADSLVSVMEERDLQHRQSMNRLESAHSATLDSLRSLLDAIRLTNSRKSGMVPEDDFLTRYLRNPVPLNDNLFTFSLQKIILGDRTHEGSSYYDGNNGRSPVSSLPEIIDIADLSVERPAAIALTREMKPYEFMKEVKLQQVMMDFPTLEITRNKLVTLRYPKGKEESLMFNFVKESENNGRFAGHFTMVAERKDLSEEEGELDIKWTLYALGSQVFIALTREQLQRIGVIIRPFDEEFLIVDKEQRDIGIRSLSNLSLDYYRSRYFLAGTDNYLIRKQDAFMANPVYINPDACIFLMKLNKLR